jgi:hypothetical protein
MKEQEIIIRGENDVRGIFIPEPEIFFYDKVTQDLLSITTRDNGLTYSLGLNKISNASQLSTDIIIEKSNHITSFTEEYFYDNPLRKEYLDLCRSDGNYVHISKDTFELRRLEKLSNI